jgi:hypothetical protein
VCIIDKISPIYNVILINSIVPRRGWKRSNHCAGRAVPKNLTGKTAQAGGYCTTTLSEALRPKVSGEYISSALAGGTTNVPGVVARAM